MTADGMESARSRSLHEVEELFDRRFDGVAAMRKFRDKLRWHVAMFGDGTAGTGEVMIFGGLIREERRIQRQRERMQQLARGGATR